MAYNFSSFDARTEEIVEWLTKEFSGIRTGRATPTLLDSVQVSSYGAKVPINQVGSVGVEDARTLRITPWDTGQIRDVETAIMDANLGISVVTDEKGLRVVFPELTSERRAELLKLAKAKLEEARVSLRGARDDTMKDVDAQEKAGEMGEDEKFNIKEDVQKRVDEANTKLNELMEKKEEEISN